MTNQSNAAKRISRRLLLVVTAIVFFTTVFVNTALAESVNKYDVVVIDGENKYAITTTETEPIEILNEAGITVDGDDRVDISKYDSTEGGVIVIDRLNKIYVEYKDSLKSYGVFADDVAGALNEIGLNVTQNDKLNYSVDEPITDGMVIKLETAAYVTLKFDGKAEKYPMLGGTVKDLLSVAGVTLEGDDYTTPSQNTKIKDKMTVTVNRVEYKEKTVSKTIKFTTKKINDSKMEVGKKKTVVKGKNGKADVTYKEKYVNGKCVSKTEISRKVTTPVVNAQVKVGTKIPKDYYNVKSNGRKSYNGIKVGDKISGRYSHYCACSTCNGNSRGITTSGKKIQNGMANPYYIACNWLPLGSVINVDGQNYTVVDRGGSGLSKKGRIDIFTPQGHSECYRLGVGSCTIKVVRLGW